MSKSNEYKRTLAVGIIQTTIDCQQAWNRKAKTPRMSTIQDEHVWQEIRKALRSFMDCGLRPQLILLPELSLPRTRLDDFERLVGALNVIAITGIDYHLDHEDKNARNQGIVFIPRNLFRGRPSRYCSRIIVGKSYPAPKEKSLLLQLAIPWSFIGDHNVYIFDYGYFGCFGVSICYDFMDIERALMYRGKIQHLFILAYNRDRTMFRSLADSLSRTVFCNVVVCNTGYHGGSMAVSPYYDAHRRTIYSHEGKGLFTAQVIQLPVHRLIKAQKRMQNRILKEQTTTQEFKDPPPGINKEKGIMSSLKSSNSVTKEV